MKYYATLETPDGKIETVNGIIEYYVVGGFLYVKGEAFEHFYSCHYYASISIEEGDL